MQASRCMNRLGAGSKSYALFAHGLSEKHPIFDDSIKMNYDNRQMEVHDG